MFEIFVPRNPLPLPITSHFGDRITYRAIAPIADSLLVEAIQRCNYLAMHSIDARYFGLEGWWNGLIYINIYNIYIDQMICLDCEYIYIYIYIYISMPTLKNMRTRDRFRDPTDCCEASFHFLREWPAKIYIFFVFFPS